MAFSLQNRIAQSSNGNTETVKNNDAIVAYQSATIGKIEREYANGLISRSEYVRLYAEFSAVIRTMGK
jgi:hypothetical protein